MNKANRNKNFIILAVVLLAVIMIIFYRRTDSSGLEKTSAPLVTQILQEQYGINHYCDDVTIIKNNGDNTYLAKATLGNGSVINVKIEYYPKKDRVYVEVPYTEVLLLN
ncbi:hypothetical protein ACFC6Q_12485 [Enterococcus gallinarum]|uniref:hypothetical protein n=1 Tax=Enterococcus TaxID=1350 RepID=UPI00288E5AF5|nr:hypothetical protein [Enterococcus gallinarum]MBS5961543.1 hypothetical protein [Enterococcus gallinarum]MDT2724829.1 hypothetical protein [Enterococcus gallinarum]